LNVARSGGIAKPISGRLYFVLGQIPCATPPFVWLLIF
jgi:hypothetical protein